MSRSKWLLEERNCHETQQSTGCPYCRDQIALVILCNIMSLSFLSSIHPTHGRHPEWGLFCDSTEVSYPKYVNLRRLEQRRGMGPRSTMMILTINLLIRTIGRVNSHFVLSSGHSQEICTKFMLSKSEASHFHGKLSNRCYLTISA